LQSPLGFPSLLPLEIVCLMLLLAALEVLLVVPVAPPVWLVVQV
jgi:hypothetical protein